MVKKLLKSKNHSLLIILIVISLILGFSSISFGEKVLVFDEANLLETLLMIILLMMDLA